MQETILSFLSLPEEYSTPAASRVTVIPVPFESDESKGTKAGAQAVIDASQNLELFDEELWVEPYKIGVQTIGAIKLGSKSAEDPFTALKSVVKPLVDIDKFPLLVGGDACISVGAIATAKERYSDLSVLQITPRTNFKPEGSLLSRSSVTYNIHNGLGAPVTQVGVRNISQIEAQWLEETMPSINIHWARRQDKWNFNDIVAGLGEEVYLSIDVAALDPSCLPAVSGPLPGGMNWYQLMDLLKILCVRKKIVGADINGFAPLKGDTSSATTVAKIAYKLIGYLFALELGVTKKYL